MAYNFGFLGSPLNKNSSSFLYSTFLSRAGINGGYSVFHTQEPMELPVLLHFLERFRFTGLNVGSPFGQAILQHVQEADDTVRKVGAADTLYFMKDGWAAYHTAVHGFSRQLDITGVAPVSADVMLIGAGAAAGAVLAVLADKGVRRVAIVSRKEDGVHRLKKLFPELDISYIHFDGLTPAVRADIVINALPVDWSNKIWRNRFWPDHKKIFGTHPPQVVIDLQYAPSQTPFLSLWEESDTYDGFYMLAERAVKSLEIWTGIMPAYSPEDLRALAVSGSGYDS